MVPQVHARGRRRGCEHWSLRLPLRLRSGRSRGDRKSCTQDLSLSAYRNIRQLWPAPRLCKSYVIYTCGVTVSRWIGRDSR